MSSFSEHRRNRIAMIGAGISGLVCAQRLAQQGFAVTVFEKSRGVGGRMAVRRQDDQVRFDHGAQYFTARDPGFQQQVDAWIADSAAAVWAGHVVDLDRGQVEPKGDSIRRYVGVPAMNTVCKRLADNVDVRAATRIESVRRDANQWSLFGDGGVPLGVYDFVLSSAPPAQTSQLFAAAPAIGERMSGVVMQPCWALLLAFGSSLELPFDGAFVHDSPLSWVASNSSKPGRTRLPEAWTLHASDPWAQQHLEFDADTVAGLLLDAFWQATGRDVVEPLSVTAHRWLYALPSAPLDDRCLFDANLGLGACGDWCGGPRVEGAYLSGVALADAVIAGQSR